MIHQHMIVDKVDVYTVLCPDLVSVPFYSIPIANYYVSNFLCVSLLL